jgi:hypothetical protein
MRGLWLFVHLSGMVMWLGGGMASMVSGVFAKKMPPAERLAVYRALGAVHRVLVRTGAIAVVVSGIALIIPLWGKLPSWVHMMMTTGLLGAIIVSAASVPTASALARLEPDPRGELPEAFARLRKRQAIVATIGGALGILALMSGTIFRG